MKKTYTQHPGKVINTSEKFTHVMAITLDPRTNNTEGVIRCITSRTGDIHFKGSVDRSKLYKIKSAGDETFEIGEPLQIQNEEEIVRKLSVKGLDFLGLEDPDIWIDTQNDLLHLYFTMPFVNKSEGKSKIHLGHAVGKDLDSLVMTEPSLIADTIGGAKELSVAPINKSSVRLNLVESSKKEIDFHYSVARLAIAEDMATPWKFGDIVFHPKEHNIPWIGGHASPGPLFSENFINIGETKRVGIMNGREANQLIGGKTKYGIFSVGLFIYDFEEGKIDWVSPQPLIRDSEAETITFASQFIETKQGEGILYAHVDDSFVRAYTLNAEDIRELLP